MELVHGNRGKCAQPCRLPYELLKTYSENIKSIEKGHLLSPKDLCSLDLLPILVNLGIKCFKIEGRLKNPEYVSTVTRIYRKYIDLAQSDKPYIIDEKDKKDLLQVFNRGGFSSGYLNSNPNNEFISKNKPNNMGIYLGQVHNFNNNKGYVTLELQDDISIGDTVSLEKEKGCYTISELMINNQNIDLAKKGNIVKLGRIKGNININDKVYKMSSKQLSNITSKFIDNEIIKNKINCKITIHKNEPVSIYIYTGKSEFENIYDNIEFTMVSDDLIPVDAVKSPITSQRIIEQINKLGGTHFEFNKIDIDLDDGLYLPSISKLNQLRRDCINKIEQIVLDKIHRNCNYELIEKTFIENSEIPKNISSKITIQKRFSILLNTLNQNYDYSKLPQIERIYIPLKYFFKPEFSEKINEITQKSNTYIYMPSILKDDIMKKVCEKIPNILDKYTISGFVISNISHIRLLEKCITSKLKNYELIANYTMNIYNNLSFKQLESLGITNITLSPELDKQTLNSFNNYNKLYSNTKTEVIVYGNLPVMTTNYCLISKSNFCLEKCNGNCDNTWNCGNNQSFKNTYFLKDRMNMNFRVIPDSFSKTTTIFNSKKTSININEINVDYIRFNFIDENIDEICEIIDIFRNGNILEGKDFTNGNFNRIV